MQVRSINKSNNTNFNSLYASKKTLKAIRCTRKELLSNRSIREAAEKYDVIVKAGTQNVYKPYPWYPLNTLYRTMLSCGTKEHVIDNPETELPLIREVKEAENDAFERKIRTYDTDDMFSAKNTLMHIITNL